MVSVTDDRHGAKAEPKARGAAKKRARTVMLSTAVAILVLGAIAWWYGRAQSDRIVIESFRVTHDAELAAESSSAVARFDNALLRVLNEGDPRIKAPGFGAPPTPPDVKVPTTGVSLASVMTVLSDLLGYSPVRINGDLVYQNSALTLFVRIASPNFVRDQSFSMPGSDSELASLFDRAARESVKRISPVALAGYCRTHRGECEPTIVLEYAIAQPPADDDPWALNMWAAILIRDGQLPAAEQRLKHALTLRPGFPLALFNYGYLRAEQKRPADAITYYQQAIQDGDPEIRAMANNNLGDLFLDRKDLKGAAAAYFAATSENPLLAVAYSNLGYVQFEQRQFDAAIDSYARASALNASDPLPFIGWASALEELNRSKDAFGILQMAINADQASAEAWFYLGDWYRQFGDKQLAIDDFTHVVELGGDDELVQTARKLRDQLTGVGSQEGGK